MIRLNPSRSLLTKSIKKIIVNKITCPSLLPVVLVIVAGLLIMPAANGGQAFAESDKVSALLVSEQLKKNPFAMKIIAEMEEQKLRYKQLSDEKTTKSLPTKKQIEIEENRKISEAILQEDLKSMEKKYLDFTPKNAFEKFVSKLNSAYHGIFWDQFDYLNAKVQLAMAAKNSVLEKGGSFYEAQQEYFKYASMPRLEMISYIQELNIKYGFADEDIQSNFDANGKLPRFEDDKNTPCYGCENQVTTISYNVEIDPKTEIKILQEKLSDLRQEFLNSNDIEEKKFLVNSLNDTVKEIQKLTYDKKLF